MNARALSWNAALLARPGELDLTVGSSEISGEVPGALRGGRLLSNGPGWTKIGDRLAHPFDGHGYLRAFSFEEDGSVRLRARFIRTPAYTSELAAGRLLHRGLGTNPSASFWKNLGAGLGQRNVANTTVQRWNGKLLAGWEGGSPYAVDADSLATIGEETFNGAIAGQATLAHMKVDAVAKRLVTCSVKMGPKTELTFREFDEAGALVHSRSASIPSMLFAHDFVITKSWYALISNPLKMKLGTLARFAAGADTLINAIETNSRAEGAVLLIPRTSSDPLRVVTLPDHAFAVHYANAFEKDGAVHLDVCLFNNFVFGTEFGFQGPTSPLDPSKPDLRKPQRLYRITVKDTATWTQLAPHGIDFPRVHPDHEGVETPVLFGAARADVKHSDPFDSLIRVDLHDRERPPQVWTAPADVFVGEPIYVPESQHLVTLLSDGTRDATTLAIFDADSIHEGPRVTVPLPLMPYAFHGAWDRP
ncbi:MAG: carotenoid oxygenase family protein [Archangium sp.]